ncbi:MAG: trypsin-like peptidase domain-containing protein, partial [Bacteroidota bacterium]
AKRFLEKWNRIVVAPSDEEKNVAKVEKVAYGARTIYSDFEEITPPADDRAEPLHLDYYLGQLFPEVALDDLKQYRKVRKNMNATVLVVPRKKVKDYDDFHYAVKVSPLKNRVARGRRLGLRQRFRNQYSALARGTGFFVKWKNADQQTTYVVATAAHLFREKGEFKAPQRYCYIQDFNVDTPVIKGELPSGERGTWLLVPRTKVFRVKKNWQEQYNGSYLDWAYAELRRNEITNRYPDSFITDIADTADRDKIASDQSVYGIGHGLGLPQKLHFDARVNFVKDEWPIFKCCLDFFSGNSGSPIFDAESHQLLGLLTRGGKDFDEDSSVLKNQLAECKKESWSGEQCQKIHLPFPREKVARRRSSQKRATAVKARNKEDNVSSIDQRRYYAPYLFLTKDSNSSNKQYLLYVLVWLPPGKNINRTVPAQDSLISKVAYRVVTDTTQNDAHYFQQLHRIPNDRDPQSGGTVDVTVQYGGPEDKLRGFLDFLDIDESEAFTYSTGMEEVAYNSAYLYLANPQRGPIDYPRVLLPLDGFRLQNESDIIKETTKGNNRKVTLELEKDNSAPKLIKYDLELNSQNYSGRDTAIDQGMEVVVDFGLGIQTDKPRKAKVRRANADEKPNRFDTD